MTWIQHHMESERLAADAELAARRGDDTLAQQLYGQAGEVEMQAISDLDPKKSRTYGISAISAVSLYYKAAQLQEAELQIHRFMASGDLSDFANEELRGLLTSIWSERVRERANVDFAPGQVVVSVRGGEIIEGGAPLDLILEKVQIVQSLFYRTTEYIRGLPHRRHGGPTKDIIDSCRPWLFQAPAGSYQFAVAIQEPAQPRLFGTEDPRPQEVAEKFLSILRATVEAPEELLPDVVPDVEYRSTFLKLTRNLSPTGKTFSELQVRSASEANPITLSPSTRTIVGDAIRTSRKNQAVVAEEERVISGILRAVHLENDWILVAGDSELHRIDQVGEAVDDLIGPMVNHLVNVTVSVDRNGKYRFRDIETDS